MNIKITHFFVYTILYETLKTLPLPITDMGKTIATEIQGSPLVGLFAYATNSYCLVGSAIPDEAKKSFAKALEVEIIELTIAGSSQIGAYLTGTENMLLVPNIITDKEKHILEKHKIPYVIIQTSHTALANNLILNDKFCFYIADMESSAVKQITESLNIPAEELDLPDWEVIGSITKITSKGGLIQKDVPESIQSYIEEKLQLKLEQGTVNFGSHVLGGGIVANDKGMVIGKASAGIEITNADMALGFLD